MRREPPLTVAGPRSPVGELAEADLDGLLATVPALGLVWDGAGACLGTDDLVGPAAADGEALTAALSGTGWLEFVHPDDRARAAGLVSAALGDGGRAGAVARDDGIRLRRPHRWAVLRVRADPAGGARGVLVDATHSLGDTARMARIVGGFNRLRQPEEIVQAVLDEALAMLDGRTATVHVLSDGGDTLEVAGMAGLPDDVVTERFGSVPLDAAVPAAEVLRTGETVTVASHAERQRRYPLLEDPNLVYDPSFVVVPLVDAEGHPFGALAIGFPDDRVLTEAEHQTLGDVAAQCALALDRARLTVIAENRQQRLVFLDELSSGLSRSLELEGTLTRLAEMTVPQLADWCVVRLVSVPGDARPLVGAAHADPAWTDDLGRLAQRLPRYLPDMGALGHALAEGRSIVRCGGGDDLIRELVGEGEQATLAAIGADSVAVFPLTARGRLLGGLAFGNRPGRPLTPFDLDLAELVATRAATLVDNARLFDERSGVAQALQASLLPGSLPDIPGIELGARYRAAGLGLDVGGDFYDAFRADDNWWIIAVGDVCGHGVEAATITGLVRHTIRASAMAGAMPSAILGRLNEMLLRHQAELTVAGVFDAPYSPRFCTVVIGAVQPTPQGVDLVLCLGGHPQPFVRRADGEVLPVGVAGTLLGVTDRLSLTDSVVHLDHGDALVCFTDGLTDRRRDQVSFGEEGIAEALVDTSGLPATELAAHVEARAVAFTPDEPTDDMAVLALVATPAGPRTVSHPGPGAFPH
jgi:serine phosphatase RsbU (regulator of sigma subunit)